MRKGSVKGIAALKITVGCFAAVSSKLINKLVMILLAHLLF